MGWGWIALGEASEGRTGAWLGFPEDPAHLTVDGIHFTRRVFAPEDGLDHRLLSGIVH